MFSIELFIFQILVPLISLLIIVFVIKWICINPLLKELRASRELFGMHSIKSNVLTQREVESVENVNNGAGHTYKW